MSAPPTDLTALNGYQLRLPTFEGPLDVLLRLIERSQLAITDVSLVAVTDQFLAYVEDLAEVPPATIAEFAAVGARLVLLKSRSLLPRPSIVDEEGDPGELVRQLVEYRTVREAAGYLAHLHAEDRGAFARGDGVAVPRPVGPPRLAAHQPGALARALRRRLTLVPRPTDVLPGRPAVTLREMVERVLSALGAVPEIRFSRIAGRCDGRDEVLTAFLAVLVLVRRRVVDAEQSEVFGDITLRRAEAPSADWTTDPALESATG